MEKPTELEDGSLLIGEKKIRFGFLKAFFIDIDAASSKQTVNRELILTNSNDLYHYTSLGGFKGIIESFGFWASDNRFLNDAEEMAHGVELAERVFRHKIRRSKSRDFATVLEKACEKICEPRLSGNLVACFSRARDNLGQWRGYGSSGVCIKLGFPTNGQRPVFFGPSQLPHKVFYGHRDKFVNLLSLMQRFESEYEKDRASMKEEWPDDHDKEYISHLSLVVSTRIVGFKNPAFRQEEEVRIVIPPAYEGDFEGGLKFRETSFGLVPYVCTGDRIGHSGLLPIEEVMIGPSPRQELIADSVRSFLRHKGYDNTVISLSKVPYRS